MAKRWSPGYAAGNLWEQTLTIDGAHALRILIPAEPCIIDVWGPLTLLRDPITPLVRCTL